jgi:hypothetical protein
VVTKTLAEFCEVVGRAGFEPATLCLKGSECDNKLAPSKVLAKQGQLESGHSRAKC